MAPYMEVLGHVTEFVKSCETLMIQQCVEW